MHSSTVPRFGIGTPAFFTASSRSSGVISARGLMWRRSMQMPGTMQFSSGYSLIGVPRLPKWRGASMWVPPWSGMVKYMTLLPCTRPESSKASSWVFQMPWMIGGCPG